MDPIDFLPTAQATTAVATGIGPDQLDRPTPCPAYAVADLAEHLVGLVAEFTASARKEPGPGDQTDGDAARLPDDWQDDLPAALATLAQAWAVSTAYDGTTHAGPVELPAREAALVALNELVVHGWDLARATGQDYDPDPTAVALCIGFVAAFDAPADDDGGLFGPPVAVGDDASALDRLVASTGRDPAWAPPA